MTRTIRLIPRERGSTLHGYVFTDPEHAREWLSMPIIDGGDYVLQEVEAGPLEKCPRCGGSGTLQTVKVLRTLSVAEFLHGW